jgi:hypothetical protein
MKSGCLLFFAREVIFEFKWNGKPYMFNSTVIQKEMQPLVTNYTCSGSTHTVEGGWFKQSDNITFAVTFQENGTSWYATHIQQNVSSLKAQVDFFGSYFVSPLKSAYHCEIVTADHSIYRGNLKDASVTFRNITVQAFGVNGIKFSTDMVDCSSAASSSWSTEVSPSNGFICLTPIPKFVSADDCSDSVYCCWQHDCSGNHCLFGC